MKCPPKSNIALYISLSQLQGIDLRSSVTWLLEALEGSSVLFTRALLKIMCLMYFKGRAGTSYTVKGDGM